MWVKQVAILILFIGILIGILFMISLYMYDNSEFSKITGFSFFSLWIDKKVRLTYNIARALQSVNGDNKILLNVVLPTSGKKVDAVLVHESGIYVIDVKKLGGWIYGREQDSLWAQVLHKDKLNQFDNPIIENKLSVFELKEMLPNLNRDDFHSLIVFTDICSFHKIEIQSKNVDVLKEDELKKYWKHKKEKLSVEEINKIYNALEKYMDFKETAKQPSINNITAN